MKALQQILLADAKARSAINDPKQQELLQLLIKHNGTIDKALDDYINTHFPEDEMFAYHLKISISKINKARIDYLSALKAGTPDQTLLSLLGNIPVEYLPIPEPHDVSLILLLLSQIATVDFQDFSEEITEFITTIFQNHDLEKDYFICSIKNTDAGLFFF